MVTKRKNKEQQYKNVLKLINYTARRNTVCRNKKNLISCIECSLFNECKSNGYELLAERRQKLEKQLTIGKVVEILKSEL